MSVNFRQWVGHDVDENLSLTDYLGGSETAGVFQTSVSGQKAVVKLFAADPNTADAELARLQLAEKLSHPNLLRVHRTGRSQLDGTDFLYEVTELAEENLSQVLPERPLTAEETRQVLQSTLDALLYLHGQGLVHADLKPANIMAIGDQLKLSTDGIHRAGDSIKRPHPPYDAPESQKALSPASDIWSLGMTVVEVLTQHLPEWQPTESTGPAVSEAVPAPFREIAQHCLLRTPELRWSIADISNKLNPAPATPVAAAAPATATRRPDPVAAAKPRSRSSKRPLVLLAIVAIIVIAIVAFPHRSNRTTDQSAPAPVTTQIPAPQPVPEPKPETRTAEPPAPAPVESKPGEAESPVADKPTPAANRPASSGVNHITDEPVETAAPADTAAPAEESAFSGVVQQVSPDVLPRARNSIQGKVRVKLQVDVDQAGNVVDSKFVSPGPSKYFANQAMQAARRWKFAPASTDARSWNLEFDFRRSGTQVRAVPQK